MAAPMNDMQARLERAYIESYLRSKGYKLEDLCHLPEETARKLKIEASIYASSKLAELENRARLVHGIHGES